MDKKQELIKQCRYYKGEKNNPFEAELQRYEVDKSKLPPPECMKTEYKGIRQEEVMNLQMAISFWEYERAWMCISADDSYKDYINKQIETYNLHIAPEFRREDNVPISLKSILFNRFAHWHSGYGDVISDFIEWYKHY